MQRRRLLVFRTQKKRPREEKGAEQGAVGGLRPSRLSGSLHHSLSLSLRRPGDDGAELLMDD